MMNRALPCVAVLAAVTVCATVGAAGDDAKHHCPDAADVAGAASRSPDVGEQRYERSVVEYRVPETMLVNHEGREVDLPRLLGAPEPVALNFIFTSCPTICPVMTATFARMRAVLGDDADGLRMVSVSIDPEHDTSAVLKSYAQRHQAPADWQFLTGNAEQIVAVQKAFDAYAGNKMNHRPLTLLKPRGSARWVRIVGLASGTDLANEYRALRRP
jgi:protein SCO1/2